TIIGVLVGFGMFGAMMTIPLYLQIVLGSTPTESGFQMLPMILGLMIASIGSGQLIARTGRYRMFPILGTGLMSAGFLYLTFMKYNSSFWFVAVGMLLIGLGLGQLMQTLTIASQNSVGLRDMGVATSASTFFRQIGGTLGTAVMLSLLFTIMPLNIQNSLSDGPTLEGALDAAMTPSIAAAPQNKAIMGLIYTNMVTPIESGAQQAAHSAGVKALVAKGVPQSVAETKVPTKPLDFSDPAVRTQVVTRVAPTIAEKLKSSTGSSTAGGSALNDTSFLKGANPALSKPFLTGFTASTIVIYWVALMVVLLAFVLALFFKTPPLRMKSALQEAADDEASRAEADLMLQHTAEEMGALVEPGSRAHAGNDVSSGGSR
ncbi:MFS transporter, partial [Arthrobacter sp.]